MRFPLPAHNLYGNEPVIIDIPDNWDVGVYSYAGEKAPALSMEQLEEKILNPINARTIVEGAKGCKNAVIIIDDITRPTYCADIAKIVIEQLEKAGVPRNKITFIVAVGMHRAMMREDFVRKLGEDIVREFRVYNHNPFYNNVLVGHGIHNTPIELNTEVVRADYKVAIGTIFVHGSTGLGGSGKILVPGVASLETNRRFHLYPKGNWDYEDNDMRTIGTQAVELLGLNFKIDTLPNGKGEIAEVFAGHGPTIVSEKIDEVKKFYTTPMPAPADLVISNNYFKPTEPSLANASKELIFGLVKPGGDYIISYFTPQGVACHYLLGKWGDSEIGGPMYYGKGQIPAHINRYFAFSHYQDMGHGASYHLDADAHIWVDNWADIIKALGDAPRTVSILPYATVFYMGEASEPKKSH
ncbi:MAG: lactate racemase domain-containing protein [Oscillospiraceae bacterium]|nr:lactate racemase domain-containing protein [Oscillospiraceae bacterium]